MEYYIITKPKKGRLKKGKTYASHIENGERNARISAYKFRSKGIRTWVVNRQKLERYRFLTDKLLTNLNEIY